ncbi:gliding motility-associated C-terminal domain-containing protein [Rurimicrobium arvi]
MKNFYYRIGGLFAGLFLAVQPQAKAQLSGTEAFLQGDHVEVGIATNGAFGSGTNAPAGYHPRGAGSLLGFIADPDKDGWTVGTPDYFGDYFLPGSPQEGWDIQYNGVWAKAWRGSGATSFTGGLTGSCTAYSVVGDRISATWEGTSGPLKIRAVTTLRKDKVYFITKVTVKNTSSSTVNRVYYERTVDPDNEVTVGGGYVTINKFEYQLPNKSQKTLVSATGQTFGAYLGLGTKDCRAKPYIVIAGLEPTDSLSQIFNANSKQINNTILDIDTPDTAYINDVGIGVVFNLGNLAPGDSTNLSYAYVLSKDDLDSAFADISPVWEYEGTLYESGDTVKLCRAKGSPTIRQDLNIAYGSGYSWTWSARPGLSNLTGTDNEIDLGMNTVTYVAKPNEAFGCVDSMVITIQPFQIPDPPAVVSPVTYCRFGSAAPLSASGLPGATMLYYTSATGGTPVTSLIPSTNIAGTYTFYASQLNGICESGRTPITIIVNPIPAIDSFTSSDPTYCGAKDGWIRFKVDHPGTTYTVYYDFNGKGQPAVTATSDGDGYILLSGLVRGSYTAIYVVNSFGCVSTTYFGPIDLLGPTGPSPVISNNGPLCAGDTLKLFTAVRAETDYLWTGPDGFTSTEAQPQLVVTSASGGIYYLVTTYKFCQSDPAMTTVVVAPSPGDPKLKDQNLCEGSLLNVEVLAEPFTDYIWNGGFDGFTANTASFKRQNVTKDNAGRYILTARTETGCLRSDTMYVTVDERVTLSVSADTAFCYGDTISLIATTNTTNIFWSPSTGMNDSTSRTPRISPAGSTKYTVTAKSDHAACPDTSGQVSVTVIPTPQVTGYDTLVRMNIPYTLLPTYGQDVVKYRWEPADSLSCANCPNPVFNSSKDMTYIIYASNTQGCTGHDTMIVRVFCDGANITMPNAFTPNNDGTNDIFYVRGTGFTVKSFAIYNRLGQEVFRKENFNANDPKFGWDGTFNGQAISDASGFVYMLEAVCLHSNNEPILIKGTVLMIK